MPAPVVPVLVVPPQPAPLVVPAAPLTVTVAPMVSLPPAPVDLPVYAAPGRITLGAAPSSPPAWVQWVLSVLRLPWKGNNWRTTVSYALTAFSWALGHETIIIPMVPPKYRAAANSAFVMGFAVSGMLTKDAGNRSRPQTDAPSSLSL